MRHPIYTELSKLKRNIEYGCMFIRHFIKAKKEMIKMGLIKSVDE